MPEASVRLLSAFLVAVLAAVSMPAFAATQRTFVASTGNDANPCSISQPCRQFAAAVAQTAAGGEVIVQDSAGYGAVTIAQSVSIIAPPGIYAGISVFAGTGITINGAGISVTLKGLTISGQGGANGIDFTAGARLRVENVEIANLTGTGINVTAAASEVQVIDSVVRDTGADGIAATGITTLIVDRVRFDRNQNGIRALDGATLNVTDSVFANAAASGVRLQTFTGATSVRASIDRCTLTGAGNEVVYLDSQGASSTIDVTISRSSLVGNQNGIGVNASAGGSAATATVKDNVISQSSSNGVYAQYAGATVILSGNVVTRNLTGLRSLSSGVLKSFGNNGVTSNGNDLAGSTTPVSNL